MADAARQVRLQRALLADEAALRKYLTYVVASEVNPDLDTRLGEALEVDLERAEEEILGPVYGGWVRRMPSTSGNRWRGG